MNPRRFTFGTVSLGLALSLLGSGGGWVSGAQASPRRSATDAEGEDAVDFLSLAARLMKDGNYDRAERALSEVDESREDLDATRLYTLRGLVALKLQRPEQARDHLLRAIDTGRVEPAIYLHLAQAHYELGSHAATLKALAQAGAAAEELPGAYLIRAQCHWALQDHQAALAVLVDGQRRFADNLEFARRHFFYLVDLGLFQEALELGRRFSERPDASADDFAALGESLRQARQYESAQLVLEAGRMRFPDAEHLTLLLAHAYLDQDRVLAAATLFEQAAVRNPAHALEAAELYRRAKRFDRSLGLNARVLDPRAKLKQRLSTLLQMERFDSVVTLAPALSRLGLLDEEEVRYALAYAYFKTGDFDACEQALKGIRSPELFANATELRRMMQTCREAGWECL